MVSDHSTCMCYSGTYNVFFYIKIQISKKDILSITEKGHNGSCLFMRDKDNLDGETWNMSTKFN